MRETTSMRRWIGWTAGMLALLTLFFWAWNSSPLKLKDRVFPKQLAEVYPGFLYRSGQIAPNLIEDTLRDLGIDLIVDLSGERLDEAQLVERETARRLGIRYVAFTLSGSGTGAIDQYAGAVEAIARAQTRGERVLVHCRAGDRRTGGVIAAYQMLVRGEPYARARSELARFSRKPLEGSRVLVYLDESL